MRAVFTLCSSSRKIQLFEDNAAANLLTNM